MTALLDISAATYVPHRMHAAERTWAETTCYVDVWADDVAQPGLPVDLALRNAPVQRDHMIVVPKVVE